MAYQAAPFLMTLTDPKVILLGYCKLFQMQFLVQLCST